MLTAAGRKQTLYKDCFTPTEFLNCSKAMISLASAWWRLVSQQGEQYRSACFQPTTSASSPGNRERLAIESYGAVESALHQRSRLDESGNGETGNTQPWPRMNFGGVIDAILESTTMTRKWETHSLGGTERNAGVLRYCLHQMSDYFILSTALLPFQRRCLL